MAYDNDLNLLYSPSKWTKRMSPDVIVENHGKVMSEGSELSRKNVPFKTIRFENGGETFLQIFSREEFLKQIDESSIEGLDFRGNPVFVYLHGGYWQWGSVYSSSYMADNFTKRGITVIALGYDIAPSCDMKTMVSQVEIGMAKILKAAQKSQSTVYICGHSAGAHLAAMMLHVDFEQKYNIKADALAGLILVSGVFDLTPIVSTDINDNLKMNLDLAKKLSPQLLSDLKITKNLKILIAYGENDTPAFKEQSKNYEKLLKEKNSFKINTICIPVCDHFNVIENLSQDNYPLTQEIYKTILQ